MTGVGKSPWTVLYFPCAPQYHALPMKGFFNLNNWRLAVLVGQSIEGRTFDDSFSDERPNSCDLLRLPLTKTRTERKGRKGSLKGSLKGSPKGRLKRLNQS